jgi:cytochrome b561
MNNDVLETPSRYGLIAILLHWLVAVLIGAAFVLGVVMVDIPGLTPTKLRYFSWHKWLGVTVLALAALRLLWRLWRGAPAPVPMPLWQQRASAAGHALLYVLMFAVPLSGYFYSLAAGVPVVYMGLWPLPVLMEADPVLKPILKALHEALTNVMLTIIIVHILAALKHQFIDRDGTLKRILP